MSGATTHGTAALFGHEHIQAQAQAVTQQGVPSGNTSAGCKAAATAAAMAFRSVFSTRDISVGRIKQRPGQGTTYPPVVQCLKDVIDFYFAEK